MVMRRGGTKEDRGNEEEKLAKRTRWRNLKYGDGREENHVNDSILKGETHR